MSKRKQKGESPQLPATIDGGQQNGAEEEPGIPELRTYQQIIAYYEKLIFETMAGWHDDKRIATVSKLLRDLKDTVKDREESSPEAKDRAFAQVAKMIAFAKSLTPEQALDLLTAKDFGGLLESQVINAEVKDVTADQEKQAYEVLRSKGLVLGDTGPNPHPPNESSSGAVSPPSRP